MIVHRKRLRIRWLRAALREKFWQTWFIFCLIQAVSVKTRQWLAWQMNDISTNQIVNNALLVIMGTHSFTHCAARLQVPLHGSLLQLSFNETCRAYIDTKVQVSVTHDIHLYDFACISMSVKYWYRENKSRLMSQNYSITRKEFYLVSCLWIWIFWWFMKSQVYFNI